MTHGLVYSEADLMRNCYEITEPITGLLKLAIYFRFG